MADFVAVDWGTSSFRAYRVDADGVVLAQVCNDGGVAQLAPNRQLDHLLQYSSVLCNGDELPFLLCGMVGSTLGLQEVNYLDCPANPQLLNESLQPIDSDRLRGWIVPGLSCQSSLGELEVMRGEETQLLGWMRAASSSPDQITTVCTPGTHSKWATVCGGSIESFSTMFSGELYELLVNHSILVQGEQQFSWSVFLEGVERVAGCEPISQVLFSCRSRVLSGRLSPQHSAAYLSGLVVGAEVAARLQTQPGITDSAIALVGAAELSSLYQKALAHHGMQSNCYSGTAAVVKGLHYLFSKLEV